MSIVSNNIKYLRKKAGYTQETFSEKIGIKRSLLGAYEEGRADPRLNNLLKMSEVFNVPVDTLISRDITQFEGRPQKEWEQAIRTKVLAITVDTEGKENIDLIPQKASAGYLNGYADPEYLEELPKFRLPFLPANGSFRAFEINGDSMLPVQPGTIVIGKYVESINELKGNKTYVMLTSTEGIVYKRIGIAGMKEGKVSLISDNRNYAPYDINVTEILEIWEASLFISKEIPEPAVGMPSDEFENLKDIVMSLQQEVMKMKRVNPKG